MNAAATLSMRRAVAWSSGGRLPLRARHAALTMSSPQTPAKVRIESMSWSLSGV
jgi:hypothetical protein